MNGVASFQTSHGTTWKIRYRVPVEGNSRVTKQVVETLAHCSNRKQAENVLALRRSQVFEHTYRPRTIERPQTFLEYAREVFLPTKLGKPIHIEYERYLRLHLSKPPWGKLLLREFTLDQVTAYRVSRLTEGASPKTVKNELDCVSAVYARAVIDGKAERDPTAGVDHGKIDNRRERLLGPAELARLLEYIVEARGWMRPMFVVLYYTGLRISDACAISWDRVSFEHNYLAQKQKKTGEWVYPPMHRMLAAELERWKKEAPPSSWVFPQLAHPSHHISRHAIKEPWAEMLAAAGVSDFTRHDMRKLLVTSLKALGAKTSAVKGISGHATDAMVDHYNLGPDLALLADAKAAIALLPDLALISAASKPVVTEHIAADEKPNELG